MSFTHYKKLVVAAGELHSFVATGSTVHADYLRVARSRIHAADDVCCPSFYISTRLSSYCRIAADPTGHSPETFSLSVALQLLSCRAAASTATAVCLWRLLHGEEKEAFVSWESRKKKEKRWENVYYY